MHNPSLMAPTTAVDISELGPRIPIYTGEFADDPHSFYRMMWSRYGSLVPVDIWPNIPATLVISHNTARRILGDPDRFSSDPRRWQKTLNDEQRSADIMPMIEWRPNALFSDDPDHSRYRSASNDALEAVDLGQVRVAVGKIAHRLINEFITEGKADLVSQYAAPLAFEVLNSIVGCPARIGEQVAAASAALFEGVATEKVNESFERAFVGLSALKRTEPGDDITTRLVQHHAGLTDIEMVSQLLTFYSAGSEIPQNLIANTLHLMMTDARYLTTLDSPALSTSTALEETLHNEPPLANYCVVYPRGPQMMTVQHHSQAVGVWLPANQPVVTSMAACTSSPEVNTGEYTGNRSHLAFGAGPHTCPAGAQRVAMLTAQEAVDHLFDRIPDVEPTFSPGEQRWRPGPFHRALTGLPVTFSPMPPTTYIA